MLCSQSKIWPVHKWAWNARSSFWLILNCIYSICCLIISYMYIMHSGNSYQPSLSPPPLSPSPFLISMSLFSSVACEFNQSHRSVFGLGTLGWALLWAHKWRNPSLLLNKGQIFFSLKAHILSNSTCLQSLSTDIQNILSPNSLFFLSSFSWSYSSLWHDWLLQTEPASLSSTRKFLRAHMERPLSPTVCISLVILTSPLSLHHLKYFHSSTDKASYQPQPHALI